MAISCYVNFFHEIEYMCVLSCIYHVTPLVSLVIVFMFYVCIPCSPWKKYFFNFDNKKAFCVAIDGLFKSFFAVKMLMKSTCIVRFWCYLLFSELLIQPFAIVFFCLVEERVCILIKWVFVYVTGVYSVSSSYLIQVDANVYLKLNTSLCHYLFWKHIVKKTKHY